MKQLVLMILALTYMTMGNAQERQFKYNSGGLVSVNAGFMPFGLGAEVGFTHKHLLMSLGWNIKLSDGPVGEKESYDYMFRYDDFESKGEYISDVFDFNIAYITYNGWIIGGSIPVQLTTFYEQFYDEHEILGSNGWYWESYEKKVKFGLGLYFGKQVSNRLMIYSKVTTLDIQAGLSFIF